MNQQVLSDAYKHARRVVIAVIGGTVFLLGLILVVPGVPGPGLIGILAGLAILGIEFAWARRWLRKIKKKAKEAAAWYRNEGGTRKS
ncbi:MAG: PGPGW domain-containing protein [Acidiferrobacterales bacterium]